MAEPADSAAPKAVSPAPQAVEAAVLKKGSLVRLNGGCYGGSLEAAASDPTPPAYALEGPGEILAVKNGYAQIRWRRPVPDVWLRLDQLETWQAS